MCANHKPMQGQRQHLKSGGGGGGGGGGQLYDLEIQVSNHKKL